MFCPFCGSKAVKKTNKVLYCLVCNVEFTVTKVSSDDAIECGNCKYWSPIDEVTGYCNARNVITTVNYKCKYNASRRRRYK